MTSLYQQWVAIRFTPVRRGVLRGVAMGAFLLSAGPCITSPKFLRLKREAMARKLADSQER